MIEYCYTLKITWCIYLKGLELVSWLIDSWFIGCNFDSAPDHMLHPGHITPPWSLLWPMCRFLSYLVEKLFFDPWKHFENVVKLMLHDFKDQNLSNEFCREICWVKDRLETLLRFFLFQITNAYSVLFGCRLVWIRKFERISIRNPYQSPAMTSDQFSAARGCFKSPAVVWSVFPSSPNSEPEQCHKWWWSFLTEY